jgi:ribonucleoside-diphosphate reductase alpha chain
MIEIGFLPQRREPGVLVASRAAGGGPPAAERLPALRLRQCPKCGEAALVRSEGCDQCTSCDYSKCG